MRINVKNIREEIDSVIRARKALAEAIKHNASEYRIRELSLILASAQAVVDWDALQLLFKVDERDVA